MTLGPDRLSHNYIRRITKKEKDAIKKFNLGQIEWSDKSLSSIKSDIRHHLRKQQAGRCVYCRRIIKIERRNAQEDIEHFLDKSRVKYRRWAFCCFNIALACHACNLEKSTRDLAPGLPVGPTVAYPRTPGYFEWVHPYFDNFHENISIGRGWIYSVKLNAPSPTQAAAMIRDCKLGEIQRIEAYSEGIRQKMLRLTTLAHKAIKLGNASRASRLLEASIRLQIETAHDF